MVEIKGKINLEIPLYLSPGHVFCLGILSLIDICVWHFFFIAAPHTVWIKYVVVLYCVVIIRFDLLQFIEHLIELHINLSNFTTPRPFFSFSYHETVEVDLGPDPRS